MITMIAAVSRNGVIGINNTIPWLGKYPSDLKRFKKITSGGTVIMGTKTWLSIGKPLPKRHNYIISSKLYPENLEASVCNSVQSAINSSKFSYPESDIWIIGGASIYNQSMDLVDKIDLTIIPETYNSKENVVRFPWINPLMFKESSIECSEDGLVHIEYIKI